MYIYTYTVRTNYTCTSLVHIEMFVHIHKLLCLHTLQCMMLMETLFDVDWPWDLNVAVCAMSSP